MPEGGQPVAAASIAAERSGSAASTTGIGGSAAQSASTRQPGLHVLVAAVSAPAFSLSGDDGQIRAEGAQGLYLDDVRILSEVVIRVDGAEPVAIARDLDGGSANRFEYAAFDPGGGLADPTLLLVRRRRLAHDGLTESIEVRSCTPQRQRALVEVRLASDLAPMAAVKSGQRFAAVPARRSPGGVTWPIGDTSEIEVVATPEPELELAPSGSCRLSFDVQIAAGEECVVAFTARRRGETAGLPVIAARRRAGEAGLGPLSVEATDPRLGHFLERSLADLDAMLMATPATPDDVFVAAGLPWFLTLFGRDSIWVARLLLPLGTGLALGTLRTLAHRQGRSTDRLTGEEPGKMLHELRREATTYSNVSGGSQGRATLALPPVYYGTVDATPLWVCLLHDAWRYGLGEEQVERLLAPMDRCLHWIADYGCVSAGAVSGFVSYVDASGHGLTNQGWKDSHDAIQFRDGRIAAAPLALCEVQGYAFEAAVAGAELLEAFGRGGAERWREFAADLAERFRQRFWVEDGIGPYPAIALDADGAAVDSLSSNIGHLLGTGLLDAREADLVAVRLGGAELNSGFGLRTLADSSAGFNPLGYHTGSVWAHDTAIAVSGLAATAAAAARRTAGSLIEGLLAAAEGFAYRMPELYGGQARTDRVAPPAYPAACRPQAWAAASSVAVLAALIGLRPDVPGGSVCLDPLPGHGDLRVRGLSLAGSAASLRVDAGGIELAGAPERLTVRT